MSLFRKKRFKFEVNFHLQGLQDVPFITGVIFAKVRLLSGGKFVKQSKKVAILNHNVSWMEEFKFQAEIPSNQSTGILEPCICRVSVRKEVKGGKSYHKLGFADVNLSQFAGTGVMGKARSCILEGYSGSGRSRQDNSLLMLHIGMQLLSSDPFFKAPELNASHELPFRSGALRHTDTAESIDSAGKKAPPPPEAARGAEKNGGFVVVADGSASHKDDFSSHVDDSTAAVIMSPDPSSKCPNVPMHASVHWHQHPRVVHTSDYHKMHRASDPDLFRNHRIPESPASSESSSGCGSLRNYRTSGSDSGGHYPGHSRNASSASQQSASHILGLCPPLNATAVQTHSRHSSTESGHGGWNSVVGLRKMSDSTAAPGAGGASALPMTPGAGCPKLSGSSTGSSSNGGASNDPRKRYSQESVGSRLDKSRLDPTEVIDELVCGLSSLSEELNDTSGNLHLSHLT